MMSVSGAIRCRTEGPHVLSDGCIAHFLHHTHLLCDKLSRMGVFCWLGSSEDSAFPRELTTTLYFGSVLITSLKIASSNFCSVFLNVMLRTADE